MSIRILTGDCREVLPTLAAESVHCVVTSPPYWGLRDYGTATWEGGKADCAHEGDQRWFTQNTAATSSATAFSQPGQANIDRLKKGRWREKGVCVKCGAKHLDSQLGLEATPQEYVAAMVGIFREVWRVLRQDGTLWLNLGDSYAGSGKYAPDAPSNVNGSKQSTNMASAGLRMPLGELKPKDLCGIPWRVAFALQADGWYLRQDIIWSKPNPMPESVTDRCTKSHEYLFLLSKSARYYFDAEVIKEVAGGREDFTNVSREVAQVSERASLSREIPGVGEAQSSIEALLREQGKSSDSALSHDTEGTREFGSRGSQTAGGNGANGLRPDGRAMAGDKDNAGLQVRSLSRTEAIDERSRNPAIGGRATYGNEYSSALPKLQQSEKQAYRNKRSVWEIATAPFSEAHFATFPPALIEPCIRAGTSEKGCCAKCGAPWARRTKYGDILSTGGSDKGMRASNMQAYDPGGQHSVDSAYNTGNMVQREKITIGWSPSCSCAAVDADGEPFPLGSCTVLDPFGGAGTTGLVADRLGRDAVLVELNAEYAAMAIRRVEDDAGMFAQVAAE